MEKGGKDEGLRGTTLKVYRYIVSRRNDPVRITDVQTGLGPKFTLIWRTIT